MSDGPTTAGSIIGRLKLDKAQWDADVAGAKADARELGATEATVKVDAKVGDAIAKLEAVRAAEEQLRFANDRLNLSYQRLDEIQQKGGASESHLMQLHLSASRAEAAHEAATRKLADAQTALNDANRIGEVFEQRAASGTPATPGNGGAAAGPAVAIGIAIAALIPLVSALAGTVAALGGAFAGMGAAGVLAVLGINHAMSDGTAAGNQFSAGLEILRNNLNQLEASAATGMLVSFQRAISLINDSMGPLNSEIGLFSQMLGTAGTIVLSTLISGFQILNPLFVQAGTYIEQLAVGWQKWTSGGGLAKFAQDASASLPQVTQALGALLNGALSLIGAFAPLGGVILGVLTLVGNLASFLTSLLGPAFLPVIAAGATVFAMFQQWNTIGPIIEGIAWKMGALGVAADAASGPIGWVIGAVSLVAAGFAALAVSADSATKSVVNYTAAVEADNGAIGKNVQAQAAKALSDSGAISAAQRLGIATKTLTDATSGNSAAQEKLKNKINALNAELAALDKANANAETHGGAQTAGAAALAANLQKVTTQYQAQKVSIKDAIKAYNEVASAQGLASISTKGQLDAVTALAASYGMSVSDYLSAAAANKTTADQAAATTYQLQLENDAAGLLTNAFNLLDGTNLSVAQAQTAAAGATNTLTDSLKTNGLTIDGNSKAAVSNQQALQGKTTADQAAAEAIAKQTGSTVAGTQAFAASKAALVAQLTATGQLTPAIQALIDKYYAIPPVVKTKAELDADAAAKKAADLAAKLAALPRFIPVTVQMTGVTTGAPILAGTNGGRAFFADGGTTHAAGGLTVPGQARPYGDSVSMMLAPSEEVISNRNGQADQNRGLLKLVNSGASHAQIAGYANRQAGTTGGGGGGGDITVTVVNKTGVTLSDLIDVQVQRNNQRQKMGLTAGRQKGSF